MDIPGWGDKERSLLFGDEKLSREKEVMTSFLASAGLILFFDHCKKDPDPWKCFYSLVNGWKDMVKQELDDNSSVINKSDVNSFLKAIAGSSYEDYAKEYLEAVNKLIKKLEESAKHFLPERKEGTNV